MVMFKTIFPLASPTNACSHKLLTIIHSTFIEHLLCTIHKATNGVWTVYDKKISEQLLVSMGLLWNKGE